MIRHTVLFRLRRPLDEATTADFVAALEAFAADAPHAAGPATVGTALGLRGEGPRAAEVSLEAQFTDPEAFSAYIASDPHQTLLSDVLEPGCEGWWSVQVLVPG